MRKVKDMAREYNEADDEETKFEVVARAAAEIAGSEVVEIARQRNIQKPAAFNALLNEQQKRWKAFASRCPGVNPDGFDYALQKCHPGPYSLWKQTAGMRF